jgi:alpha-ketoglutaric semialdehyde dehydrogenase
MQHNLLRKEVFGPFALVVKCKYVLELQQCIAEINGQLTATIVGSVEEISFHLTILVALSRF